MSLYPDLAGPRARAILHDLVVALCILVFAVLGVRVHDGVDRLAELGRGVSDAGTAVQSGFAAAAAAAGAVPVIGGPLGDALRQAGGSAGGQVAQVGADGERSAHQLARLLGVLVWALPTGLLLLLVGPPRRRQIQRLRATRAALNGPEAEPRRRLLALRAALTLPEDELLRHTPDPAGDLLSGRLDGLVAAALEDAGVASPTVKPR